jgi:hypothetical protein
MLTPRHSGFLLATIVCLACGGEVDTTCASGAIHCAAARESSNSGGAGGADGGESEPEPEVPAPPGPYPLPAQATGACDEPAEPVADLTTVTDLENWMTRRWAFCAGKYLYQIQHDGIEFRSDGLWSFMDLVGDELVPREGPDAGGEWVASDFNDPPTVNITRNGGTWHGYMHFSVSPLKVNMGVGGDGNPPDYVAVAPPAN